MFGLLAALFGASLGVPGVVEGPAAPLAPLGVDEVLRSVAAHHPSIAVAVAERAAAAGDRMAADGAFDPSVRARGWGEAGSYENGNVDVSLDVPTPLWGASFTTGWRLGLGKIASYEKLDATDARGEIRAGLSVPLWRNGPIDRRRAHIARMLLEEEVAAHGVDAVLLDLSRTAALRYWEWVARGARLQVAEDLERLAEDRAQQLAGRVAVGDIADVERIDNERLVASRQQRVVLARRALEQAAIELALFLRDDVGDPVVIGRDRLPVLGAPAATPLDIAGATATALARRPELRRLEAQQSQAEVELSWAENQFAPGVDVFGEVRQGLGGGARLGNTDALGGVSVEIPPLFRVGRGRSASASAGKTRVQEQRRLWADRVRLEVEDSASALRAAEERVTWATREVAAAAAVEDAERKRFDAGDSTILQVNLREQANADARSLAIDAALDVWRARAQLDAATGELVPSMSAR
jgi:outer membrane protein, heavy metal efflux system